MGITHELEMPISKALARTLACAVFDTAWRYVAIKYVEEKYPQLGLRGAMNLVDSMGDIPRRCLVGEGDIPLFFEV